MCFAERHVPTGLKLTSAMGLVLICSHLSTLPAATRAVLWVAVAVEAEACRPRSAVIRRWDLVHGVVRHGSSPLTLAADTVTQPRRGTKSAYQCRASIIFSA